MWILFVEIIAAIIASSRGWRATPILLLGGSILVTLLLLVSPNSMGLFWAINIIVTVVFAIMAIIGKKSKVSK